MSDDNMVLKRCRRPCDGRFSATTAVCGACIQRATDHADKLKLSVLFIKRSVNFLLSVRYSYIATVVTNFS